MSKELYILEKIKAQSSDNSNLCWAACLEMIHKITNNSSPINFQSVAVQSYKTSVCYSDLGLNYQSNNIVIKESCLAPIFKDYGLKITDKHDYIKDFDFYFNHLNNTGLPLLLGINTGQGIVTYGHLVLVCGYGYCGENKYLLTFDPDEEILQKFWKFEDSTFLYRNNESIRLWAVDYLENRPINNENKIKKISNNSLLKFTAQLFKNSRNSIKKFYEMELSEKIYKVDNCETYFFYWEEATINYITQKIEKIFTDNNLDDKGSEISFSEGYIYINNNDKFYPISIPSSLKKDVSFINKNDFDRKLKTKELPKTILFNN